ncbi:MFS transporter [Pantoea sp. 18069]|uniref:MFS transporter n=1 Tax=Pantoea sp. 18069 TaxID=2681415 RepID=UPI0013589395|nr:MFS transporter [Pantoea sp. 18069]
MRKPSDAGARAGWRAWFARHALDLSPLQSPGFRLLYTARLVSVLVYGVLGVAVAWQVWSLTQSSFKVAGVGLGLALGTVAGLLWGGVIADRANRRTVMVAGRAAYVLVVLVLLLNSLQPTPQLGWIYAATVLSGLAGGISAPALMATLPTLVPGHQLPAAGALGALAEQLGRLTGPLLAGLLIAHGGSSACYALALAGAVLTPLLLLRLPALPPPQAAAATARVGPWQAWRESARFARGNPVVGGLLVLDVLMALCATPWVLLPQLGVQAFAGDAQLVGMLHAAPAAGAFLAAAGSGWTRRLDRPGLLLIAAAVGWGLALLCVGLASQPWLALALLVLAGAFDTVADIVRGALLQRHTPDALRGRISALWLLEMHLAPALGGLALGGAAQRASAGLALVGGGALCALASLLVGARNRALRATGWQR